MAKQVSVIQFTGKLGPTVGFRGSEGKVLMRQRLDTIANPQTEEQVAQRARFKLTSQVSGMLGDVGRVALQANGYKGSQRGILNQMIMPSVAVSAAGEAELNHVLQLIKKPALINHVVTASVKTADTADGFVATGVLQGLAEGEIATKAILIYDKTNRRWIYNSATGTDDNINIPVNGLTVDDVNIYFYAVLATPTTSKGRAIYESVTGPDTDYKLLASRLSNSNFAYSRMLTAARINGESSTDKEGYKPTQTYEVGINFESEFEDVTSWPVTFINHTTQEETELTVGKDTENIQLTAGSYSTRVSDDGTHYPRIGLGASQLDEFEVPTDTENEKLYLTIVAS